MPSAVVVASEQGCWGKELVVPLQALDGEDFDVEVATPSGGQPVLDPRSLDPDHVGDEMAHRVRKVRDADPRVQDPAPLSQVRGELEDSGAFPWDAVVFPGGHGTLWDINMDRDARALLRGADEAPDACPLLVCHSPGLLAFTRASDGSFLVEGRTVTGFPNAWDEDLVDDRDRLPDGRKLPYWIEDEVEAVGGRWDSALGSETAVRVDGGLVTARGPESIEEGAAVLLDLLGH